MDRIRSEKSWVGEKILEQLSHERRKTWEGLREHEHHITLYTLVLAGRVMARPEAGAWDRRELLAQLTRCIQRLDFSRIPPSTKARIRVDLAPWLEKSSDPTAPDLDPGIRERLHQGLLGDPPERK